MALKRQIFLLEKLRKRCKIAFNSTYQKKIAFNSKLMESIIWKTTKAKCSPLCLSKKAKKTHTRKIKRTVKIYLISGITSVLTATLSPKTLHT